MTIYMRRKQIHLLAVLMYLFISGVEISPAATQSAADPILEVRQRYAAINRKLSKYKQIKKNLEGYSIEGGELVAYLEGETVVKIVANFYGESGKAVEEYYYDDGQLIFVFRKESSYDEPRSGRISKVKGQRFYFKNGRLVRWINEKGKILPDGDQYSSKQEEYLNSSKEFTEGSRSTSPTIQAPNP
jgi:hypothetical protein